MPVRSQCRCRCGCRASSGRCVGRSSFRRRRLFPVIVYLVHGCHFCQIVSLFRPAAQPLGCQRVAVWAVLNGKTARFAAPNGRFYGLVGAVSPVRNGMAWAASRRCNYFVSCFRKAAGWLAVILCNASQALGPRHPRLVGLRHRPRQRSVGMATMIRLCGPRRPAGACGRGDCAPRPA